MRLPRRALALALLSLAVSRGASSQEFFWDSPYSLAGPGAKFLQAQSGPSSIVAAWQEPAGPGAVHVSLATGRVSGGTVAWTPRPRAIGPIEFTGNEPALFTLCVGAAGEILLATPLKPDGARVSVSRDGGATFASADLVIDTASAVAPRVFRLSGGGYVLFVTQGDSGSFSLSYARSDDGLSWTPFAPLNPEPDFKISFLPAVSGSGGTDVVVFQSLLAAERTTYQLWTRRSADGGRTFSLAERLTDFSEAQGSSQPGAQFWDNQNPHLSRRGQVGLALSWERGQGSQAPQAYWMPLDSEGRRAGPAERITSGSFTCSSPQGFMRGSVPGVAWSDNRNGSHRLAAALRTRDGWEEIDLEAVPGSPVFARPLPVGDELYLAWQDMGERPRGIFVVGPDRTARAPALKPLNFRSGVPARQDGVLISWDQPEDSSGIAGYSTLWTRDAGRIPPETIGALSNASAATEFADADGSWYFSIRAMDRAGNWSPPSRIEFVRDTSPPPPPTIASLATDEKGFLASNTFSLAWTDPEGSDATGYTYALIPVPRGGMPPDTAPASFPSRSLGPASRADYRNIDDGEWLFELAAVDSVGNISRPARIALRTDKFVPYTAIDYAESRQDESGRLSLSIYGRGFATQGYARRVIIDADGKQPWDRVFELSKGEYGVKGDRLISGVSTEGLDEGKYRVGVDHERRGLFLSGPILSVLAGGTVKYGDYAARPGPGFWKSATGPVRILSPYLAPLAAFLALCGALVYVFGRRLANAVADGQSLRLEIQALFQGGTMPAKERTKRLQRMKKRGAGLRLKFSLFVIILVVLIVLMVSVPLGVYSVRNQEDTLARALSERAGVLLESLSASARTYMGDTLELGQALYQMAAMEEAAYVTITGPDPDAPSDADVVWATNDASLETEEGAARKLKAKALELGVSALTDELSPRISEIRAKVAEAAKSPEFTSKLEVVKAAVEEYRGLNAKARKTVAEQARIQELIAATDLYNRELGTLLSEISNRFVGSVPEFGPESLRRGEVRHIFYKPVLRYDFNRADYYIGMVRLEISTERISRQILESRLVIIQIAAFIALVSIAFGVLGALFLALIVIRPIKSLVRGVEIIRDTPSKEKLEGLRIDVRTRDELRTLSDTINQMTLGLVRGAKDNADLLAGEQDQRELLPLQTDSGGKKLSVGAYSSKDIEFFGYYKGATLVSGDYLDFRPLDGRYFAFIKSDVSGHGVSAAMIMAVVASAFRSWFDGWTPSSPGFALDELCYRINDTLNVCDFKGKFATLFVGIIDSRTGRTWMCHAGDNVYRLLDSRSGRLSSVTMAGGAPVAGPFASFMLKGRTPFLVETLDLAAGDVLLLYTDGLEDSRHYARDASDKRIPEERAEAEEKKPAQTGFKEHGIERGNFVFEYFKTDPAGEDRIARIVESVVSGGAYSLERRARGGGTERLDFDYSDYRGGLDEIVLALVSAEKAFRMFRPANATADDVVKADRRIDEFLREHFKQYFSYCDDKFDNPEEAAAEPADPTAPRAPSHYLMYDRLLEDEQYDDITVLAIRRKPGA